MPELLAVFQDEVPGRCGCDIVETCGNQCMKHLVREFRVGWQKCLPRAYKGLYWTFAFQFANKCDAVNGSSIWETTPYPKDVNKYIWLLDHSTRIRLYATPTKYELLISWTIVPLCLKHLSRLYKQAVWKTVILCNIMPSTNLTWQWEKNLSWSLANTIKLKMVWMLHCYDRLW